MFVLNFFLLPILHDFLLIVKDVKSIDIYTLVIKLYDFTTLRYDNDLNQNKNSAREVKVESGLE